eukprot:gene10236-7175_t
MRAFTEAVSPCLSSSDLKRSVSTAESFVNREGKVLQQLLLQHARGSPRIADEADKYFAYESGKALPCFPLLRGWPPSEQTVALWNQSFRTKVLEPPVVDATWRRYAWKEWISQTVQLAPAALRTPLLRSLTGWAQPLDTTRYEHLFNAARVPGQTLDSIQNSGFHGHIVVAYGNNFFSVDIADVYGQLRREDTILRIFHNIVRTFFTQDTVSVATSLDRRAWSEVRADMRRITTNASSISIIESALFVLCLHDSSSPTTTQCSWLDKCLRIDVYTNRVEVSGESSLVPSALLQHFTDDVIQTCTRFSLLKAPDLRPLNQSILPLPWVIKKQVQPLLHDTSTSLSRLQATAASRIEYRKLKTKPRQRGRQYEAVLQLATLMALWRLLRYPLFAVEPVYLPSYGSHDRLPLQSTAVLNFLAAVDSIGTPLVKRAALRKFIEDYQLRKEAIHQGRGFCAHLLALHSTAERSDRIAALFTDTGYLKVNSPDIISSIFYVNSAEPRLRGLARDGIHVCWAILCDREYHFLLLFVLQPMAPKKKVAAEAHEAEVTNALPPAANPAETFSALQAAEDAGKVVEHIQQVLELMGSAESTATPLVMRVRFLEFIGRNLPKMAEQKEALKKIVASLVRVISNDATTGPPLYAAIRFEGLGPVSTADNKLEVLAREGADVLLQVTLDHDAFDVTARKTAASTLDSLTESAFRYVVKKLLHWISDEREEDDEEVIRKERQTALSRLTRLALSPAMRKHWTEEMQLYTLPLIQSLFNIVDAREFAQLMHILSSFSLVKEKGGAPLLEMFAAVNPNLTERGIESLAIIGKYVTETAVFDLVPLLMDGVLGQDIPLCGEAAVYVSRVVLLASKVSPMESSATLLAYILRQLDLLVGDATSLSCDMSILEAFLLALVFISKKNGTEVLTKLNDEEFRKKLSTLAETLSGLEKKSLFAVKKLMQCGKGSINDATLLASISNCRIIVSHLSEKRLPAGIVESWTGRAALPPCVTGKRPREENSAARHSHHASGACYCFFFLMLRPDVGLECACIGPTACSAFLQKDCGILVTVSHRLSSIENRNGLCVQQCRLHLQHYCSHYCFSCIVGGAVQATIFNPFDRALYVRVKHRRRRFLDWRNFDRPFQGFLNASFYRTTVSGAYFLWQDSMRMFIESYFPSIFHESNSPHLNSALVGLLAGSLNGFALNPLQVVKFRMWNGSAPTMNFWSTSMELFREGGYQIFFRGCLTTIVRDCVFGVTYESVRRLQCGDWLLPSNSAERHRNAHRLGSRCDTQSFVSNMCAALAASIISTPFNFVRTVVYGAAPGATPMSALALHRALLMQVRYMYRYGDSYVHVAAMNREKKSTFLRAAASSRRHPHGAWSWFNSRLNVGWGSLRIGLGMAMSQNLFYLFQNYLSPPPVSATLFSDKNAMQVWPLDLINACLYPYRSSASISTVWRLHGLGIILLLGAAWSRRTFATTSSWRNAAASIVDLLRVSGPMPISKISAQLSDEDLEEASSCGGINQLLKRRSDMVIITIQKSVHIVVLKDLVQHVDPHQKEAVCILLALLTAIQHFPKMFSARGPIIPSHEGLFRLAMKEGFTARFDCADSVHRVLHRYPTLFRIERGRVRLTLASDIPVKREQCPQPSVGVTEKPLTSRQEMLLKALRSHLLNRLEELQLADPPRVDVRRLGANEEVMVRILGRQKDGFSVEEEERKGVFRTQESLFALAQKVVMALQDYCKASPENHTSMRKGLSMSEILAILPDDLGDSLSSLFVEQSIVKSDKSFAILFFDRLRHVFDVRFGEGTVRLWSVVPPAEQPSTLTWETTPLPLLLRHLLASLVSPLTPQDLYENCPPLLRWQLHKLYDTGTQTDGGAAIRLFVSHHAMFMFLAQDGSVYTPQLLVSQKKPPGAHLTDAEKAKAVCEILPGTGAVDLMAFMTSERGRQLPFSTRNISETFVSRYPNLFRLYSPFASNRTVVGRVGVPPPPADLLNPSFTSIDDIIKFVALHAIGGVTESTIMNNLSKEGRALVRRVGTPSDLAEQLPMWFDVRKDKFNGGASLITYLPGSTSETASSSTSHATRTLRLVSNDLRLLSQIGIRSTLRDIPQYYTYQRYGRYNLPFHNVFFTSRMRRSVFYMGQRYTVRHINQVRSPLLTGYIRPVAATVLNNGFLTSPLIATGATATGVSTDINLPSASMKAMSQLLSSIACNGALQGNAFSFLTLQNISTCSLPTLIITLESYFALIANLRLGRGIFRSYRVEAMMSELQKQCFQVCCKNLSSNELQVEDVQCVQRCAFRFLTNTRLSLSLIDYTLIYTQINQMKLSYRTALVAFMLLAFLSVQCATAQDSDDEWPQDSFDASSGDIPSVCRASVPSVLYAGNTAENVIVCRNSGEEVGSQTAFLVAGFLQPAHTYQTVLQNFSVVRQARVIEKGESVSFRYNVLPSSYLDPGDYNLVLGVYFQGGAHNQTFLSVAFNATVLVEASSTDPRTIMTYVTLVAILCGVIYGVAVKLGAFKSGTKCFPELRGLRHVIYQQGTSTILRAAPETKLAEELSEVGWVEEKFSEIDSICVFPSGQTNEDLDKMILIPSQCEYFGFMLILS